ncbi:glyoxalase family protein [Colletotrichum orchidophilum]|uniref:Glyoxalase family protein n=1 Tax=Colletotrichum orchidophilum TaxID=1209926 RepID=A0A1G4BMF7_9PEZI|nr:glyoxalase family protein [Colletotrichum orchidophilum]OHF02488.1 glyoxalase family protein [Colletotrichum orchidophilum]
MAEGEAIGSAWKIIPSLSSRDIVATSENDDDSQLNFCYVYTGNKAAANIFFFHYDPAEFSPGRVLIALGTEGLDEF